MIYFKLQDLLFGEDLRLFIVYKEQLGIELKKLKSDLLINGEDIEKIKNAVVSREGRVKYPHRKIDMVLKILEENYKIYKKAGYHGYNI